MNMYHERLPESVEKAGMIPTDQKHTTWKAWGKRLVLAWLGSGSGSGSRESGNTPDAT